MIVLAGDGGTYDIGFQCLSSAAERNENLIYFCLDNEGYMNTGAQKSSSTPHYARTGLHAGRQDLAQEEHDRDHGRARRALCRHRQRRPPGRPAAQGAAGQGDARHPLITLLIPCLDGWGLADDAGLAAARLAVETGAFPLVEIEDGRRYTINADKTRPIGDYLALQRRYRHLSAEQVADLQAEIDDGWARLQRQAAADCTVPA